MRRAPTSGTRSVRRPPRTGALAFGLRAAGLAPGLLVAPAASGALASACGIGLLATSGWLITRAAERPPIFALSIAIGSVQAFALGQGIARYLQRIGVHNVSLDVLGRLRLLLFDALEPQVPGGMTGHGAGAVLSGFVSDTDLVAQGTAKALTAAVDVTTSVVLGAAVACLVEPSQGAVLGAGALGVVGVAFACARPGRAGSAREAAARADVADAVIETVRSARELVAYGREDLVARRFEESCRRSSSAALRRALVTGLGRACVIVTAGAAVLGVVGAGLVAHDAHRLSGVMCAVVTLVTLVVLDQCANLPVVLSDTDAADAAAERLRRLVALEAPVGEPQGATGDTIGGPATAELDDVAVVRDGAEVLQGISLQVAPGRRVAVVGPSGSGKTTVVHALLRFVACARGRASIGGVDVRKMSRAAIARHIGWMAEETHVFAASLAENLRLARPAASDAQCLAVLGRVGLSAWYDSLPQGLGTVLGSGGQPVSAGERQRLGMARALLAGGPVLLLDEPTAHLDPVSSARVLSELLDAAGSRTVLVVSHEPDIGSHVDEVVALDSGRVVGDPPTTGVS